MTNREANRNICREIKDLISQLTFDQSNQKDTVLFLYTEVDEEPDSSPVVLFNSFAIHGYSSSFAAACVALLPDGPMINDMISSAAIAITNERVPGIKERAAELINKSIKP